MTPSLSDLATELSEFLIDSNILLELLDIKLVLQCCYYIMYFYNPITPAIL